MSSILSDEPRSVNVSLRRRLIIVVIAAGLLLAAIVIFNIWKANFVANLRKKISAPPQTVSAAKVKFTEWQPEVSAVGSMRAVRGVDVTTEVTGLVRALHFKSGEEGKAGQVLVELNADPEIAQQRKPPRICRRPSMRVTRSNTTLRRSARRNWMPMRRI